MSFNKILSKTAYNEICRLCLNMEDNRYYSIFEVIPDFLVSANESLKVFQLIRDEISTEDELPHQICTGCRDVLKLFLKFKQKIDNSRIKLLEALADNLVEQVDQIEDTDAEFLEEKSGKFEFLSIERLERIDETSNDETYKSDDDFTDNFQPTEDSKPSITHLPGTELESKKIQTYHQTSVDAIEDTFDEIEENDVNDVQSDESFKTSNKESFESNKEEVPKKLREIKDLPILYCTTCKKEYKRTYHLKRHIKIVHNGIDPNKIINEKLDKNYDNVCNNCGTDFYTAEAIEKHKENQNCAAAENLKCKYCDHVLKNVHLLEEHLKNLHPHGKRHLCPICNKSFPSVSNRNTHIQSHNLENTFLCDQCNQGFKSSVYLNKHKKTHEIRLNDCPICNQHFDNLAKFEYHLKAHEARRKYQCQYCDRTYMQLHHKANHERVHTGERPYLCNICGKDFKQDCNFKMHLKIHSQERKYHCEVKNCNKSFIQRGSYIMHLRHHNMEKKYQCHHCGRSFVQKSSLNVHLRIHTGERPFKCTQCSKAFIQAQQLKYHYHSLHNIGNPPILKKERISTARLPKIEKDPNKPPRDVVHPYVCHLCNRSFKVPSSLSKHLKTHSETRKHVCNQCSSSFKRAEHLRIHINGVHLKQKNFSCEICNKKFAQSGDRNIHMKRHQNLKPHICTFCKKPFRLLKALRAHERIHTGEKIYRCEFCQETFMTFSALATHTVKHQDGTIPTPQQPIQIISKSSNKIDVQSVDIQVEKPVILEEIIGNHELLIDVSTS